MIFITVGSQKFQFNRLLEKVDDLLERGVLQEPVFAQVGYSTYVPKHFPCRDFLKKDEMNRRMEEADLILTHGGTASIIESVRMGKQVVAAARLAKYGEHVDDHQTEIIRKFVQDEIIEGIYEMDDLADAIHAARTREHKPYISQRAAVVNYLRELILQDG